MEIKRTISANDIRESISRLRYELQQYHDNASKGGSERRRNMILLRWDIRKLERRLKAMEAGTRTKSINMTQTLNKSQVEDILNRHANAWVAVHSTDANGNNESYDTCCVDGLLSSLDKYTFNGATIATPDNTCIDIWAQNFNEETRAGLRRDLAYGNLFIAHYTSDELGTLDILLWH